MISPEVKAMCQPSLLVMFLRRSDVRYGTRTTTSGIPAQQLCCESCVEPELLTQFNDTLVGGSALSVLNDKHQELFRRRQHHTVLVSSTLSSAAT